RVQYDPEEQPVTKALVGKFAGKSVADVLRTWKAQPAPLTSKQRGEYVRDGVLNADNVQRVAEIAVRDKKGQVVAIKRIPQESTSVADGLKNEHGGKLDASKVAGEAKRQAALRAAGLDR